MGTAVEITAVTTVETGAGITTTTNLSRNRLRCRIARKLKKRDAASQWGVVFFCYVRPFLVSVSLAPTNRVATRLNSGLKVGEEIADDTGEEAAAEEGGADGAASARIGDAHVTAAGVFLDGHFGNDGDAHACPDHVQQAGKLTALENDLGIDASAAARGHRGIAKAVAVAQKQEGVGAEIGEGKRTAASELVTGRERGEEPLGNQRSGVKFAAAHGQSKNGEVQCASAQAIQKDRSDFFEDAELSLRELSCEGSEARRKKIRRDGGNDTDVDCAGDRILLFDDLALGGFEFAQDGASVRKKGLPQFCESHAAAQAIEKSRAEFVLELEDLLGKRRLGDVRLFRGAREGESFSDSAEVAELVEFHGPGFAFASKAAARQINFAEVALPAIGCAYPLYPN
jgi:hypothetical protein